MCDKNVPLSDVLIQLQNAIEQQDWECAGELDRSIRDSVQKAISSSHNSVNNADLIDTLTKIQTLYSQLISGSEQSRNKLSEELKKISRDNKVANTYLNSSQYR